MVMGSMQAQGRGQRRGRFWITGVSHRGVGPESWGGPQERNRPYRRGGDGVITTRGLGPPQNSSQRQGWDTGKVVVTSRWRSRDDGLDARQ